MITLYHAASFIKLELTFHCDEGTDACSLRWPPSLLEQLSFPQPGPDPSRGKSSELQPSLTFVVPGSYFAWMHQN